MEEVETGEISLERGLEGDHKGARFPRRQITVMANEAWIAALADLPLLENSTSTDLSWTTRRANLLVEQVELPRAKGGIVAIGSVQLEITGQTVPCRRMDEAQPGLLKALYPDWRGGITCRVLQEGVIQLGDAVNVLFAPPERRIRLPG